MVTHSVYYVGKTRVILSQHEHRADAVEALAYWGRMYPADKLTIKSR